MVDMQGIDLEALYYAPITLRGQYVTLVPLTLEHSEALFQALNGDEELWRYIPVAQPQTLAEMQGWVAPPWRNNSKDGVSPLRWWSTRVVRSSAAPVT
jgi:hypothetical protein